MKLDRMLNKLYRQNLYLLFNETHTHTHIYIYIYVCVCVCVCVCKVIAVVVVVVVTVCERKDIKKNNKIE